MTKDVAVLIKHHPTNLLLPMPISTAVLPFFKQFPIPVLLELIIPHLILIILLTLPILIDIEHIMFYIRTWVLEAENYFSRSKEQFFIAAVKGQIGATVDTMHLGKERRFHKYGKH